MKIYNVKFIYTDKESKYDCIDFRAKLIVPSIDYSSVVYALEQLNEDYTNVRLLEFSKIPDDD